jgi:glycosyltransferase involved in cell wall biosynthesis
MRVGFDVTPLLGRGSGVARYTTELVNSLREDAPEVRLELFSNRPIDDPALAPDLAGLRRFRAPYFPNRTAWMQTILPVALAARHLDVCHYTNFDAPVLSDKPSVVTVHDVSLLVSPELHPRRRVLMLSRLASLSARRARAVTCPTESARRDAIERLDLDPARVHVAPSAVSPRFRPLDEPATIEAVCGAYRVKPGFVLFVGAIEPRKNLVTLARAFARLRADGFDNKLVICGGWGWKSADLRPAIDELGIADSVVFTGYVPDDDVVALLNGCGAFAYPSLYEGFGLPIVEAFACGAPVVTSNRGATAEVSGAAALLADPTSVEDLADALQRTLSDATERERMRAAGFARAAEFSRPNAARRTVAVYEAVLGA